MKLVPLGDRVVLKQLVAEETTKSGIVLPGQSKEKPQQAEVVAVGPGGTVDGANDHRIVMAAAVAATRCQGPVVIRGAEAVKKSYPGFWREYENLGGDVRVL